MCRYAYSSYKPHYACFDCRKTFKRRLLRDVQKGEHRNNETNPAKCPECGNLMADMGMDFESPKKEDKKAWAHMAKLYKSGITFHSCGCSGPGYIPNDDNEILNYLGRIKKVYLQHQQFWSRRKETPEGQSAKDKDKAHNGLFLYSIPVEMKSGTRKNPTYDVESALKYWHQKVKDIDANIQSLES